MPLTPLSPKRTSAVGFDSTGKPIYTDKDGNKVYGLKDNNAAQAYNTAQGGQTWSGRGGVISGGKFFQAIPMKATMGDQREPESEVPRDEQGNRTVTDKTGKKTIVGDRINARVGAKRDPEAKPLSTYTPTPKDTETNAEFFRRAKDDAVTEKKRVAEDAAWNTQMGMGRGTSDATRAGALDGALNVEALKQQQTEDANAAAPNAVQDVPIGRRAMKDGKVVGESTFTRNVKKRKRTQ
jgi:hypothetical protein